ncbi:heterodisulfide reductase-related iron-sulfur binding cluster [Planctomycetota bacterium]
MILPPGCHRLPLLSGVTEPAEYRVAPVAKPTRSRVPVIPHRPLFWSIEGVWLFYVMAAVAVAIFLRGVMSHVAIWSRGEAGARARLTRRDLGRLLLDGVLGLRIVRGDASAGVMHGLLMWGFLGLFAATTLAAVDHYLMAFLQGTTYLVFSIGADISGVMLVTGILFALCRRYVQRVERLENRRGDLVMLLWLLAVAFSGFMVEGLRLAIQAPPWAEWSFAGLATTLAYGTPSHGTSLYPLLWWGHAALSLALIAAIPYTKLFHTLAAPASIYVADQPPLGLREGATGKEAFSQRELVFLDACTRCGRCVEVCPSAGAGEPFSPRGIVVGARSDLWREHGPAQGLQRLVQRIDPGGSPALDAASSWYCTTCLACVAACPVYAAPPHVVCEVRRRIVEEGTGVPSNLTRALELLYKYANPWEASKKKRARWSKDLDIPNLSREGGQDRLLYFVGCTTALDTRAQKLALAFARILTHAGVSFGTLGKKEPCCGAIAYSAGEIGLFEEQLERSVSLFERHGIREVVTSSPHCFHTFQNEYPLVNAPGPEDKGGGFAARHYVQLLDELVQKGSLRFESSLGLKVTYHDPCFLGRHNQIYDAPRRVIRSIPGVELLEMAHAGPTSLCCGGGGGRVWQEELEGDQKMSERRIREARAVGADFVVTACPLCLIMLDDARKTAELEDSLQVIDLNELVDMALRDRTEQ